MEKFIRFRISFAETGEVIESEYFGKNPTRTIKKCIQKRGYTTTDKSVFVDILSERTPKEELHYCLSELDLFVGRNDLELVNRRVQLYKRIQDCMYMLHIYNIPFDEKLHM